MRFGVLMSIGRNIADSLACGIGLSIGFYGTDIFGEVSRAAKGFTAVDFLKGAAEGGPPSESLATAIALYSQALRRLCQRHDVDVSVFKTLKVRFCLDVVYGPLFSVTVEDHNGRCSVDEYLAFGGNRLGSRR